MHLITPGNAAQDPADIAQRRRALAPDESFIVQAPAGSGKTELLIQRYLVLLARVSEPEQIVAMTYTRKAAGEMRERILGALSVAQGDEPAEPHARFTWQLARKTLNNSPHCGKMLLAQPSRCRVRTIDSLCHSLAAQMPYLSRAGGPLQACDDATEMYHEAARRTIALIERGDAEEKEGASLVARMIIHLDNRFESLERGIVELLKRRDQWLRHAAQADNPAKLRKLMDATLQEVVTAGLRETVKQTPDFLARELSGLLRKAAQNLLSEGSKDESLPRLLGMKTIPTDDWRCLEDWKLIAERLLTKEGAFRKRIDKRDGFPPKATETEQMKTVLERLQNHHTFERALGRVCALPPASYAVDQLEMLGCMFKLLARAVATLEQVFAEQGTCDHIHVARSALDALGEPDNPTDLNFALDCRVQHLLVDEFQDTSYTQYELLRRLTAGWGAGDERTLFLVGDPMQSIYRFREAEVGLFMRVTAERRLDQVPVTPLTLTTNFRSSTPIVAWVNEGFEQIFPKKDEQDLLTGAVSFAPSEPGPTASDIATVKLHPYLDDTSEHEASDVIGLIRRIKTDAPAAKTAVLVRARTHLYEIVRALRDAGIRFRAVDIDPLGERPAVQDLLALTRAIYHLGDRVSWLSILRAPWCGLHVREIYDLLNGDLETPILTLLEKLDEVPASAKSKKPMPPRMPTDALRRIQRIMPALQFALDRRGHDRVRLVIERAWSSLGGPATLRSATDYEDVRQYFTLLDELEDSADLPSLEMLEERTAELYASPDTLADDSLQIMTLHKAKGLQFDHVIIPHLGARPQVDTRDLITWLEIHPDGNSGGGLILAPMEAVGSETDGISAYLKCISRERARHETARLLYVGVTRAKRELHLFGKAKFSKPKSAKTGAAKPAAGSLLEYLWPVVENDFVPLAARHDATLDAQSELSDIDIDADEIASVYPVHLRRLPINWNPPAPPPAIRLSKEQPFAGEEVSAEAREEFVSTGGFFASETARHAGTVVHRMLCMIARDGAQKWPVDRVRRLEPAIRSRLIQQGIPAAAVEGATRKVLDALLNAVSTDRGKWILDSGHLDAQCELAVTGFGLDKSADARNYLIDRTFVAADGVRWIIDYKTSTHEGANLTNFLDAQQEFYKPQLENYAGLLAQMDNRPCKLGLYFPLLNEWREWEAGGKAELKRQNAEKQRPEV